MKNYECPEIELMQLAEADILTSSSDPAEAEPIWDMF